MNSALPDRMAVAVNGCSCTSSAEWRDNAACTTRDSSGWNAMTAKTPAGFKHDGATSRASRKWSNSEFTAIRSA